MQKQKGFTIIQLIVVLAIIAILIAIVISNVVGYIHKSKNASVKANMATIMTNSALYFSINPTAHGSDFINQSSNPDYAAPATAVQSADNGNVAPVVAGSTTTQAWCACAPIYNTGVESGSLCIDSTGYKKVTTNSCSTTTCTGTSSNDYVCSTTTRCSNSNNYCTD
jgi:prepilin-type N-terminal cleavage/methylation domain-containing protein